ncbi:MAG: DUF4345 domain-containing protein [Desulfobacterales bacterium]
MKLEVPPFARIFLLICVIGLVPIALGYGLAPSVTLEALFDINVQGTNHTHIFRAVMGLYFGMVAIWALGAFRRTLTRPALISCAVFMLGLAFGRVLSFLVDGQPHWLLVVYALLEIFFGVVAILILRRLPAAED